MTGKQVVKILLAHGWTVFRQEGSHLRLGNGALRTTVPLHGNKDLMIATLASIERQTGVKLK